MINNTTPSVSDIYKSLDFSIISLEWKKVEKRFPNLQNFEDLIWLWTTDTCDTWLEDYDTCETPTKHEASCCHSANKVFLSLLSTEHKDYIKYPQIRTEDVLYSAKQGNRNTC